MIDNWKIIDDDYLNYLRNGVESRIPHTDYGTDKMKPFFGALFERGNLVYVTQITSPKQRHYKMKNSLDFHKYYIGNQLTGVVNLNYMFPVPKDCIKDLDYGNIEEYRSFPNEQSRSKYIKFLKKQLSIIKSLNIEEYAIKVYNRKYDLPDDTISKRCFDFKAIEEYANKWSK